MDRIMVESAKVGVHAYGPGASVSASFACYTPADADRLVQALNALVDVQPGRWPEGIDLPKEET